MNAEELYRALSASMVYFGSSLEDLNKIEVESNALGISLSYQGLEVQFTLRRPLTEEEIEKVKKDFNHTCTPPFGTWPFGPWNRTKKC